MIVSNHMRGLDKIVVVKEDDTIGKFREEYIKKGIRGGIVINRRGFVLGLIRVRRTELAAADDLVKPYIDDKSPTIHEDEPIGLAREKMIIEDIGILIVVDSNNRPVGMLVEEEIPHD